MFSRMCVTHVLNCGPFLKIFGQVDREHMPQIEVALRQLHNQLMDSPIAPLLHEINATEVYLVQQSPTSFFRRCKALNVSRSGVVRITLIDHGHEFDVSLKQLQLVPEGPDCELLRTTPAQVSDGILCGVQGAWDVPRLDAVRQLLVNTVVSYRIEEQVQFMTLITLTFKNGSDVSESLLHQSLAQSISIGEQRKLIVESIANSLSKGSAFIPRPPKQAIEAARQLMHQPSPPPQVRGLVPGRPLHSGITKSSKQMILNHLSTNTTNSRSTIPPNIPTYLPKTIEPIMKSPIQQPLPSLYEQPARSTTDPTPALRSNTLLVGSKHSVYVSYIEDGPSLFSIHLKSNEHDLDQLMAELGNLPLTNLCEKPTIGMACVARYSEDKNLYRAVIMNIKPTTCLVAYVDYGNSEDVVFSDIYDIPAALLKQPIFAMRFTLSGYKQLQPDNEMTKQLFSSFVMDNELVMVVRPLDGPPFVQYCDLLLNGESVFDLLVAKTQTQLQQRQLSFPAPLELLENELVVIRGIESAQKFYVQQCRNISAFEDMMYRLNQFGPSAQPLLQINVGTIGINYHEIAESWCRVKVISEEPLVIQYTDIGTVNQVCISDIREIPAEFVKMPQQAIQCCLEGFEDIEKISETTVDQLELLADDENDEPRNFKVFISERRRIDGVLIVNLVDVSSKPNLDVSQRVFMMCMPPIVYRQFEQQRIQRKTKDISSSNRSSIHNSTTFESGESRISNWDSTQSPESQHSFQNDRRSASVQSGSSNPLNGQLTGGFAYGQKMDEWNQQTNDQTASSKKVTKRDRYVTNRQLIPRFNRPKCSDGQVEQVDHDTSTSGHFSQSTASSNSEDFNLATNELAPTPISLNDPRPHSVCVCWWISPLKFYVQLADALPNFKAMMDAMQEFYQNRQPLTACPEIGSFVVYRKPDGIFYRAQIRNRRVGQYVYRCVDIGDKQIGTLDNMWPLEQRFAKLDRLAIRCSLKGVALNYEVAHIEKLIERLLPKDVPNTVVFLGTIANEEINTMLVEFTVGDETLKEVLVRDGLVTSISDDIELSRLVGQVLSVQVSNSQLPDRFAANISGHDPKNTLILLSRNLNGSALQGRQLLVQIDSITNENCLIVTPLPVTLWPITNFPVTSNRLNVTVAHVESPNCYYVQNLSQLETLKSLLNNIYETYVKDDGDELVKFEPHSLCAGKSEDGNWYRCRIENANNVASDTVLVRYIDYGNCELIHTSLIRGLTNAYLTPNAQALKVFLPLQAIAPEADVMNEISGMCINFDLNLTVVEFYKGSWIVEIGSNGLNLIDVLATKQLVRRVDVEEVRQQIRDGNLQLAFLPEVKKQLPKKSTVEEVKQIEVTKQVAVKQPIVEPTPIEAIGTSTPDTELQTSTPVAAEVKSAQIVFENRIDGYISHADRPDRFYIQLQADLGNLSSMHENIQIVAPALTDLTDFSVGTRCIVKYSADDCWYRAVIVDSDSGITSVQFIDYGNTDTITVAGLIKCMNEAFATIKPFAIPCALPLSPKQASDWTEAACELMRSFCDQTITFEYLSTGENCNLVRLWLPPNREIMGELIRDGHAALVPYIVSGQEAFVSHINSLADFYIQMQQDTNSLEIVSDYLITIDPFPPVVDFTPNKICTAKYVEDDGWYRAKILDHSATDGTDVLFIDYGNTATATELRELPKEIADMPQLSKQCSLQMPAGVQLWSNEAESHFHKVSDMGATIFTVQLVQPSNRSSLVRLTNSGTDLSTELASLCNQFSASDMDMSSSMMMGSTPITKIADPIVVRGVLFRVTGSGDFYVLPDAQKATHAAITEQLLQAATFPAVQVTHVGDLCVAKPVGEDRYLRARVLSINSDDPMSCNCLFIDTGRTVIATNLRAIPHDLASKPKILEHYMLPSTVLGKKEELLPVGSTCYVQMIKSTTRPQVVCIFADANCQRPVRPVEDLPPRMDSSMVGDSIADISLLATLRIGFLSYVENSKDFWIQANCAQMNEVVEALQQSESFPSLETVEIGDVCAAKWSVDGEFYRSRVVRPENGGGFRVAFIDYGNTAVATDFRQLPESLRNLPEMVAHCRLQKDVANCNNSNEPLLTMEEFNKLALVTELHVQLIDINAKPNVVRLFLDAEMTKEIRVQDDEMSSCASMSLNEDNGDTSSEPTNDEARSVIEALITWVLSSRDFYLQDKHNTAEAVEQMAARLVDASAFPSFVDPIVGDLCAARYVDDGIFYRAKIVSVDRDKKECEVVFIDYGNSSTATDLRVLPSDLVGYPACATHCSLLLSNAPEAITDAGFSELIDELADQSFFIKTVDATQSPKLVRIFLDPECQQEVFVNWAT